MYNMDMIQIYIYIYSNISYVNSVWRCLDFECGAMQLEKGCTVKSLRLGDPTGSDVEWMP